MGGAGVGVRERVYASGVCVRVCVCVCVCVAPVARVRVTILQEAWGLRPRPRGRAHPPACMPVLVRMHRRVGPDINTHTHPHNAASTSCPRTGLSWTVYFGARVATAHLLLPPSTPHRTPPPTAHAIIEHIHRERAARNK